MEYNFSQDDLNNIESFKSRYPDPKAAIMPTLWLAQKKFGWISPESEELVAKTLALPLSHVHGVASFYTMYFKKEMGKHHIQVCTNVSCKLRGGDKLFKHVSERLGIENMEATDDRNFSLEEAECMGSCGSAPMIAVNEEYFENMTLEKIEELINNLELK